MVLALFLTPVLHIYAHAAAKGPVVVASKIDTEYTGNGGFFFGISDQPTWKDALKGYLKVKELDRKNNDIVWLTPAVEGLDARDVAAEYLKSKGFIK